MVALHTTQGDILLRFFPADAPEHVANFLAHCRSGYYEGCTFHRVIPDFMIQSGDPNSKDDDPANDGRGGYSYKGPGTTLKAEFNDRRHLRGTLSMARTNHPDTAGSQFFICQTKRPGLDRLYTVFGEVIDGIEVVDAIISVERDARDRPLEDQVIEEVCVEQWPTAKVDSTLAAMKEEDKLRRLGKLKPAVPAGEAEAAEPTPPAGKQTAP
ncbi:MAG: peptidylprolyl isomerase [Candidatus Krumholzibacteriota bacterium]|nr:peptidylprolyl isomerase [Candidatus Krumholzibacteriota bacterium]